VTRPVARLHLRSGAELIAEPFDARSQAVVQAFVDAGREGGLDGGLDLQCAAGPLCHGHIWDRLDAMLLAWLSALDEIQTGTGAAIARFPDTRIECELVAVQPGRARVVYEDVDATVDVAELQVVIEEAAARLLAAAGESGQTTSDLARLAARPGVRKASGDPSGSNPKGAGK